MANLEAARIVAKVENVGIRYILAIYDENTIARLASMYNREMEMCAEDLRENW